jgi:CheY-like chemotaxis protein
MESPIKVLIADDEYLVGRMLQLNLQRGFGYQISDPVTTIQQAFKCIEQEHIDVILMDVQFSGKMEGIVAARTIIDQYGIPIIFITGYVSQEILEKFEAMEPVMCLEKPIGPAEVDCAIKSLLTRA